MRCVTGVLLSLFVVSGAVAQDTGTQSGEPTDGREILKKAAEAAKNVKLVGYEAEYSSTGWVKPYVADVKGKVVVGEQSKWELDRFLCEVTLKPPGSEESHQFSAGSNGDLFFLVDSKTKTVYADIDSAVLGSQGRHIMRVLLRQFGAPDPFKEELEAKSIELKGTETVHGEECYHVFVKPEAPPEQDWFFSKRDLLPRKVIRSYLNQQDPKAEKGTTQLTITDLEANLRVAVDPFKVKVPKGYTKTDEFAP
jgi:outer membrane lipoprotein-sorting protein